MRNSTHLLLIGLSWIGVAGVWPRTLEAQDFRIDTDLFVGANKEPETQNLTLFANGVVYDFLLTEPEQVTVLDPVRGRIHLLHVGKQLKTTITTEELLKLTAEIRAREPSDKQSAFFLDPQFEHAVDAEKKELVLKSRPLTYRVVGMEPKDKSTVQMYREFADWYARLNAVMTRGSLPPFSRLQLNQALAEKSWIPTEIQRTVIVRDKLVERRLEARTHHIPNWLLSNTDHKRIELVADQLANFQQVSPKEFVDASQPPRTASR